MNTALALAGTLAESSSEPEDASESWAVIVKVDDAPSGGEPYYDMQSALIASSASS